jgi:hypothetical protein
MVIILHIAEASPVTWIIQLDTQILQQSRFQNNEHKTKRKEIWVTFMYIRKVSNIFKYTNFESAHKDGNSIKRQLMTHEQRNPYSNSRVYIMNQIVPRL